MKDGKIEVSDPNLTDQEVTDLLLKDAQSDPELNPEPIEDPSIVKQPGSEEEPTAAGGDKTGAETEGEPGKDADQPKPELDQPAETLESYKALGTPDEIKAKLDLINSLGNDPKIIEDIRAGRMIPKQRFDEAVARAKQEVSKQVDQATKPKDGQESLPKDMNPEDVNTLKWIFENLGKVNPKFKEMIDSAGFINESRAEREAAMNELHNGALSKVNEFAKSQGIVATNARALEKLQKVIADYVQEDPKYRYRYYVLKDLSVVDQAIKDYESDLITGPRRAERASIVDGKKKTLTLPKQPGQGSISGGSGDKPKDPLGDASGKDVDWNVVSDSAADAFFDSQERSPAEVGQ